MIKVDRDEHVAKVTGTPEDINAELCVLLTSVLMAAGESGGEELASWMLEEVMKTVAAAATIAEEELGFKIMLPNPEADDEAEDDAEDGTICAIAKIKFDKKKE